MIYVLVLIGMLFCHIVDDYYLQGCLANLKQRDWWEEHWPDKKYKHDFIIALIEHSFSWAVVTLLPMLAYYLWGPTTLGLDAGLFYMTIIVVVNTAIHAVIDHRKANTKSINLTTDQLIHIGQILAAWAGFVIAEARI